MPIAGLGVAWVDLPRFEALLIRHGERLLVRLFTDPERRYAETRRSGAQSLAVRFAAKLAARRALGARGIRLREIEVVRARGEAPMLRFHGRAAEVAAQRGVVATSLSLTHDAIACIGQVVLECAGAASSLHGNATNTRLQPGAGGDER